MFREKGEPVRLLVEYYLGQLNEGCQPDIEAAMQASGLKRSTVTHHLAIFKNRLKVHGQIPDPAKVRINWKKIN